eukprot:Gregarina_sp_Pseudo_9__2598@NODE_285_length_3295_cov_15_305283_g267_i0_p1_GENE_NODE_285_length_3295_cov_15_305283_g267_i0NODE_285_length_3295_cov_15_305283_g267_i0_p1_ORF_typecomplete_len814_score126_76Vac14_Fab1_bd/PF12755_7/2_8e12Vac14_Fab1_bd/PF12755_7/4e02Adaptin_N/PF01602_20/0_00017Cnd1/PF12717_7/8_5e03Cnd1/PF12717_7/4_1e02Cnd1/PF12717_7/2_9_NODE_285_length_3295_cov_15_305283_g267_i07723213
MPSIFKRIPSTQQRNPAVVVSDHALNTLGPNVCKALAERQVETKRKGAKEIEELIRFYQEKELSVAREQTTSMLNILLAEFLESQNRDIQIGGLIGVLGAARGLQENLKYYLGQIMVPVLKKFSATSETTLRYYAAECIYNLCILAPAGVVCLLEELLELVFALWKDSDTRLARPANFTDVLVKDLTSKFATHSQVLSLLRLATEEVTTQSSTCPLYVISWLDLLIKRFDEEPADFPAAKALVAVIHLASYPTSEEVLDQLEVLIERQVGFLRLQAAAQQLEALQEVQSRTSNLLKEGSGHSQSIITSLVSAICGLSASRRRIQVASVAKSDINAEDREFIAALAPALLPIVMNLLLHSGLNTDYIKMLSSRIQFAVGESPTRNVTLVEISKVLGGSLIAGKEANNYLIVEAALQWLLFLASSRPPVELPSDCVSVVSSLVSSDRSNIRNLAVNCVVELVQDGNSLQSSLDGAVRCLGDMETESQAIASLGMIHELLAKHNVNAINASLSTMDRSTPEGVFRYIIACFFCAFAVYNSNLYLKLKSFEGWSHTEYTHLLMRSITGVGSGIVFDPTVPATFSLNLLEAILMMLRLPNCWKGRALPSLYASARLLLPTTSPAFAEVQRFPTTMDMCDIVESNVWTLPTTAFGIWEDKFVPLLRNVLYRLINRSLSTWSSEVEVTVEKEASPKGRPVEIAANPPQITDNKKDWTHEEEVICQDTPTRVDGTVTTSTTGFFTETDNDGEAREERRPLAPAEGLAPLNNNGESGGISIDMPVNETPNQSTIMSDISTEPNSPTTADRTKSSTLTRMIWS